MAAPLVFIERGTRALHAWIGPVGLHLFWPDLWKSRFDHSRGWRRSTA